MDISLSKRFLVALASLAILCGLSGCTYDLVVRAGYANPSGVYSAVEGPAVEGPAAAGSGDAGAPVAAPDGGRKFGSNANYAYAVGFGANNVAWSTAYATPEISVATPTTDVPTVPLLIQSQAPWASAATNIAPGNLVLNVPAPVGAGDFGSLQIQQGGTTVFKLQTLVGQTIATYGAVYPGNVTPSASNYLLWAKTDGTTATINAATQLNLDVANSGILNLTAGVVGLNAPAVTYGSAVATPAVSQTALASTSGGSGAAGQGMSVTAQAGQAATGGGNNGGAGGNLTLAAGQGGTSGSATNGSPGNVVLNVPAPLGGATHSKSLVQEGGVTQLELGNDSTYSQSVIARASTLSLVAIGVGNYVNIKSVSNSVYIDGVTVNMRPSAGGTPYMTLGTTAGFTVPLAGLSTTPLSFSGQTSPNTVACGTGGTQTISAAQAIIPFFVVSGGTLASDCVIDFGTNAPTGVFEIGILTASFVLNGHNLSIKNGTTTLSYAALPTHNLIDVRTFGTNNVAVSP